MALDATLETGLQSQAIRVFTAVQIALPASGPYPAYTVNLIDGAGAVTFFVSGVSTTFAGEDSIFGTLASISAVSEAVATEAPRVTVTLLPPTAAAVGQLNQPLYQGAPIKIWFGLVNEATGAVVGLPELLFSGRLDTAKTTAQANVRTVELDVSSVFERMFIAQEGDRLTDRWHQSIHPGEGGLRLNNDALQDPMWGAETQSAAVSNQNASTILKWMYPNAGF